MVMVGKMSNDKQENFIVAVSEEKTILINNIIKRQWNVWWCNEYSFAIPLWNFTTQLVLFM